MATTAPAEAQFAAIEQRFRAMQRASREQPAPDEAERCQHLRALRAVVAASISEFADAINADYGGRAREETLIGEIVPSLTSVRDCLSHLHGWMAPETRPRAALFWPGFNRVSCQPKGVVLIISPWNYPVQLAVGPLAAALAAGNRVIVKPSELTPRTSALLKAKLEGALGAERVTVATGGPEIASALCRLPFDHILFTGSTSVGKKVMAAAAESLTPVTLELGGKSPTILHESFDLDLAAERIARGKLLNAGQTCIAPDYVLVPHGRLDAFVARYAATAARFYPRVVDNPQYTAIINARHYDRIAALAADARAKGARLTIVDPAGELPPGEVGSSNARRIAPVVLAGVTDAMAVMQEEIFGPLLPVVGYADLDSAIAFVNARPRPLALYYFDDDRARADRVLARTVSGGATVNDTMMHFAQEALPFGGIGPSGMGAYHGRDGFLAFSHAKATFFQSRYTLTSLLSPPYGKRFQRAIRMALRRGGARPPA